MNKTKINYWVDLIIALAFVLSAVSGLVFLLPVNGSSVLGVSYLVWDQIHTWGSLLMITGVLAHLALHWQWIVAMTRKTFFSPAKPTRAATTTGGSIMSRRQFLGAAGLGVAAFGVTAFSYKTLFGSELAEESQSAAEIQPEVSTNVLQPAAASIPLTVAPTQTNTSALPAATSVPETAQTTTVACPKGLTYDPYPGRCRHYVDSSGDGYCDYSIPVAS